MFAQAIEDILRDHCTSAAVRGIEGGGSPAALWGAVAEAGFLDLLAPEEAGGANLPMADLFPILTHFGRCAIPVPLAQSFAARALVAPGIALPTGLLTLASALRRSSNGSITCTFVPFGALAEHVLAVDQDSLLLLPCVHAHRELTDSLRSQTATLTWAHDSAAERIAGNASALSPFAAAIHAALLSGAMTRVFEMTLQYCNERVQFGRSLGKFQAVQHQLSVMAEQVAASCIAAEAAYQTQARTPRLLPAAIAKARASEAAVLVANTAHALHGAIGVTEEYDLQLLTRRLHEWRMAHGSESHWNRLIGEHVLASGATLCEFVRSA
jgi:acyl-CoA dehydrogenase